MTTRSFIWAPLFIAETGSPGRLGVIEINEGRERFRMLEGRLSADEQAAIGRRLDQFQRRIAAQSSS